MRVVTLVIILLVLGVVGITGASWWFRVQPVWGWYQTARGYGQAKTPDEAVERFLKAVRDRDYHTAAEFCTGEYAYELEKTADAAHKMAEAIDDFEHNMKLKEIKSNKVSWVLNRLQPFPKEFKKSEVRKLGDSAAEVVLYEDYGALEMTDFGDWQIDRPAWRALSGGLAGDLALNRGIRVPIVKEGDAWKLKFELTTPVRDGMSYVRDVFGNYVQGLEKIKYDIKNHVMTKDDVESQLRTELQNAKKS